MMGNGRIPKDPFYGELVKGTRRTGCPLLRFKGVCKKDMKSAAIDTENWELMVKDRSTWRHLVNERIKHAENTRNMRQVKEKYQKSELFSHQRCCLINPGANS